MVTVKQGRERPAVRSDVIEKRHARAKRLLLMGNPTGLSTKHRRVWGGNLFKHKCRQLFTTSEFSLVIAAEKAIHQALYIFD